MVELDAVIRDPFGGADRAWSYVGEIRQSPPTHPRFDFVDVDVSDLRGSGQRLVVCLVLPIGLGAPHESLRDEAIIRSE